MAAPRPSSGQPLSLGSPFQGAHIAHRHLPAQQPSWLFCLCSGDEQPARLLTLQPPLGRPHHFSWLVPWLRQVPPEGSPRRQLHLQSQHIIDISIMLLLIFVDHPKIHTLCLVKPLVHKRNDGICHVKLPPQSGKLSSPASHRTVSSLHMKAV